uniref:Protein HEXIM1 n=1 Tax=Cacopsylla melanoneura TaxID=428564 RepID=A0A8D8LQS0_9HEMI
MEVSEEMNILSMNSCKEKEEEEGGGGVIGHTNVALSSCDNADSAPTSGGNTNDRVERKKKTRRGKPRGKNYKPYNKAPKDVEMKMKRSRQRFNSRLTSDQPEAPNNSNQFIIEDHNFHQIPIDSPERPNQRKCYRDSSFTSVESDGENFYSSPEDEVDYIIQDFSVTYKNLREETLGSMSKNDLIRQVLTLEERIENLVKKKKGTDEGESADVGEVEVVPGEKIKSLECENNWLKKEVERLTTENSTLRRRCRSTESSIDSESDSSSSSSSSDSSSSSSKTNSPMPILVNGGTLHGEAVVHMEEDLVEVNIAVVESSKPAVEDSGNSEKPAVTLSNGTSEKVVNSNDNV